MKVVGGDNAHKWCFFMLEYFCVFYYRCCLGDSVESGGQCDFRNGGDPFTGSEQCSSFTT